MAKFEQIVKAYTPRMMKDFQINQVQACGIWGNLGHESIGMETLQEIAPTVKGSKGGYGWMQWTGPRRRKYEAWCQEKKMNPASDEANYQYLVKETLTDEWKSIQQVRKTTTIEAATETFMLLNLRPGIKHLDSRVKWARRAADALKSSTATQVATGAVIAAGAAAGSGYVPVNYLPHVIGGALVIAALAGIATLIYRKVKNA